MFRRTGARIAKFQEEQQRKKDLAAARSTVLKGKAATISASASKAKSTGSSTAKKNSDKADDTDEFLEWRANEKRKENISKKKLHRRGPTTGDKREKISCREMAKEPEAHILTALVLTIHVVFYLFVAWRTAAMSEGSGLPEAARLDVVESQGLQLIAAIGHWISIFAVFFYAIEQLLTLFFDGVVVYFTTSRVLDFLLWCASSLLSLYGSLHSPLLNVPRIVWRIYVICSLYLKRATSSTTYYRNKVVKLNTLAKRQRKSMVEMNVAAEELRKDIERHKNHISELERALLIAAESEAVR